MSEYKLIPFAGLLKISEAMKQEMPFEEWHKIFSVIETLIYLREAEYKDGIKFIKLTVREFIDLETKYEKVCTII